MKTRPLFSYDPQKLPRELKDNYISASKQDIQEMLGTLGLKEMSDFFSHIPENLKLSSQENPIQKKHYEDLAQHIFEISEKNKILPSFLGDGLPQYKVSEIVPFVASLRGLTTAYTPYQPERSQGTLQTLWLYQSAISMLTGFEAINASLYERSTCLFEALNCALRLTKNSDTVLLLESLYPNDREVILTHARHTKMNVVFIPVDKKTGLTSVITVKEYLQKYQGKNAALAFPQINQFGLLENVDELTDLAHEFAVQSIAVIDPMLLATGGLKAPADYGTNGAHMIVGEGQHLAIGPNFGGPGLGIFGIRYNEKDKNSIRSSAGRYVGKTKDLKGKECKALILSTREQHIRREKATSNICSNQSFVATLAGAAILHRGEKGMSYCATVGRERAVSMAQKLTGYKNVTLTFPNAPFYNEIALSLPCSAQEFLSKAYTAGIYAGVDISQRVGNNNSVLLSFSDWQSEEDLQKLELFFKQTFGEGGQPAVAVPIPENMKRKESVGFPDFSLGELKKYYQELNDQNVSPDDAPYPLGSCTMKYNPYINDYAAGLSGFTDLHPEVCTEGSQGSLEILYEIQEMFKHITGLAGVTTQPVAGAQGELVGLKLFQGYFEKRGEKRDIIIIPRSAHGTNPATATMAGFETYDGQGAHHGIIIVEANEHGTIDLEKFKVVVKEHSSRIAGVMVTNPNTSGIFEENFKEMADLIHSVGGLVYMDGANMNAIAGHVDLGKLGVDAVHNNLHKTWTIPHGGGGPGDAIVAVSEKLVDFLPGIQVIKENNQFKKIIPKYSIGSFHRHLGNFAHKVRCYTYIKALGSSGVREMSAVAVLSSRYLQKKLEPLFPTLPFGAEKTPRMHEFILTLTKELFEKIEKAGTKKALTIARVGKLFLDFGIHSPTVAFPEVYGLMIEPTESFSRKELDRFAEVTKAIFTLLNEVPEVLQTVPHFTPAYRVDELEANKNPILSEKITKPLAPIHPEIISALKLGAMPVNEICQKIVETHRKTIF
ncbi:MAG: aminomethyl-transferring glycine dehydrogenase subunit GcvPB [Bacteriovoracaceae bacterium]|nr:aminomethyl-transferring glycine dehydrogenase subunit GcvPB [Bacteriovoracaceae bacterium]